MGKTLWANLVAIALVLTPAPAGASVGPRPERLPVLRRTTVVSAARPGSVDVVLPRDVRFAGDISMKSKGRGRILAFALVRAGVTPPDEAPIVYGWAVGRCNSPGCPWGRFVSQYMFEDNLRKGMLPAGTYRLYLVTDGAPGRIKLELGDLRKGKTSLTADGPATVDMPLMTPTEQPLPRENLYWSGSSTELSGPGVAIVMTWVDAAETQNAGAAGLCVYESGEPPSDDTAFMPGCPAAFNPAEPAVAKHTDVGYRAVAASLPRAAGGWYTQPAGGQGGTVALWLAL